MEVHTLHTLSTGEVLHTAWPEVEVAVEVAAAAGVAAAADAELADDGDALAAVDQDSNEAVCARAHCTFELEAEAGVAAGVRETVSFLSRHHTNNPRIPMSASAIACFRLGCAQARERDEAYSAYEGQHVLALAYGHYYDFPHQHP